MRKKYDIEKFNNIPIIEVAKRLGIDLSRRKMIECFTGHDSKTPSLSFNIQKNYFNCFGCGIAGGSINLVKNYCGCDFKGACDWLNEQFFGGISSTYIKPYKYESSKIDDVYIPDAEVYVWIIDNANLSEQVVDYFESRNINRTTLEEFKIRDVENPIQFINIAREKWGTERLVKCGLWHKEKDRPVWWQHIIIFPFYNIDGKINYLQGRFLNHTKIRWMNLIGMPSTIFNEQILSNLEQNEQLVITEGLTDALSLYQNGINVVGIMGASNFKNSYVELLRNFNIIVAADNDNGGDKFFSKIKESFSFKTIQRLEIPKKYNDVNEALSKGKR